ncbi:MAG TPA: TetR/AcrR family transcriptional regulator [Streptosporangiaceae bacterium]
MPRLTERSRQARRRRILDAAQRCFARSGFRATSMQEIFTESGLSAGAVYSHFASKEEIIDTIAEEVIHAITVPLHGALAADEPPPLGDVLECVLDSLQRADVAAIAITVWGEAVRNADLHRRLAARYHAMRDDLARLVAAHQQRGALPTDVPADQIAQVLIALGPAFLHQRALDPETDATDFAHGLHALLRPT